MRLDAAITDAVERLALTSDSARLDAEILLCQTIDMPRSYLFAHPEDELDDLTKDRFETLLQRRINGEPMSYITGTKEYCARFRARRNGRYSIWERAAVQSHFQLPQNACCAQLRQPMSARMP